MRISIDLDGVLAQGESNWPNYLYCVPVKGAVNALRELRRLGIWIIIHTARCTEDRIVTAEWLNWHGFVYDELVMGKPVADIYLDDKGERFTTWADYLEKFIPHSPE